MSVQWACLSIVVGGAETVRCHLPGGTREGGVLPADQQGLAGLPLAWLVGVVSTVCRLGPTLLSSSEGFFLDAMGTPRTHGNKVPPTGVSMERLKEIGKVFSEVPGDFNVHSCEPFSNSNRSPYRVHATALCPS